jgi:amino acid transporter
MDEGAKTGWGSFNYVMAQSPMPDVLRKLLYIVIVVSNFLCALSGLTSCSRMLYAFSRDGGIPFFSNSLKKVSVAFRTPVNAIWVAAILSIVATLYGDAFFVLATGCAVFLYISYVMAIGAGLLAEGKSWTQKGPFNLGGLSKPIALFAVIGCLILIAVGVQPPNEKVGYLIVAMIVAGVVIWYAIEKRRFGGPPIGEAIARKQAEIAAREKALGGAAE